MAGETEVEGYPGHPLLSLPELVDLHERISLPARKAKVAAVALNTRLLDEDDARAAIAAAEAETGLVADDPVRFGADRVLDAILAVLQPSAREGPAPRPPRRADRRLLARPPAGSGRPHRGRRRRRAAPLRALPGGAPPWRQPYLQVGMDRLSELKVAEGSDEQIAYVSQLEWDELEQLDAVATVWAERNTRSFTNADSERYGRYLSARRELSKRGWERIAAGDLRWCGTLAAGRGVRAGRRDVDRGVRGLRLRRLPRHRRGRPGRALARRLGGALGATRNGSRRSASCGSSGRTPT